MTLRTLPAVNRAIVGCTRCPRLRSHCRRIARDKKREFREWDYWGKPVPGFGDPRARLLIVGLAPAAHGANRTGRMFTGDSSGAWLYEALHRFVFAPPDADLAGLRSRMRDCYAQRRRARSAATRQPRDQGRCGRSSRPNCSSFAVRVVVTLGRVAHGLAPDGGWWRLAPRERPRFGHGTVTAMADGTTLISSYHPSRQNTNTRKLTRAMWHALFRAVREILGD